MNSCYTIVKKQGFVYMRKIVLLLFFFLLNGCALNSLFLGDEVDTVTIVGQSSYMKHHRAYFTRTQLHIIRDGKKHLYMYNPKTHDVGVLLHKNSQYLLYNMSQPNQAPFVVNAKPNTKYWRVLKYFRSKGFKIARSLASVGIEASDSKQIYKGVKTLLIQIKDYSRLQARYQQAIKTYDASGIRSIKTKLPKHLIASYYNRYAKRAKTRAQLLELKTIALKIGLRSPNIPEPKTTTKKISVKNDTQDLKIEEVKESKEIEEVKEVEEIEEVPEKKPELKKVLPPKAPTGKSYHYYLKRASLEELSAYISNQATKNPLSSTRYYKLTKRKKFLQEEKLLNEGNLEELIAAYKTNKNPKYKKRIMKLIKEKQEKSL